jgi:hypothetical protein
MENKMSKSVMARFAKLEKPEMVKDTKKFLDALQQLSKAAIQDAIVIRGGEIRFPMNRAKGVEHAFISYQDSLCLAVERLQQLNVYCPLSFTDNSNGVRRAHIKLDRLDEGPGKEKERKAQAGFIDEMNVRDEDVVLAPTEEVTSDVW